MLTARELQTLRNMGNEAEDAADEIGRLRSALRQCADAIEWQEGKRPHNLSTIGRAYWRARWMSGPNVRAKAGNTAQQD